MVDLRRGFGRIGYVALAIYELAVVATLVGSIIEDRVSAADVTIRASLAMVVIATVPPLIVYALWLALLWVVRGFVRVDAPR